MNQKQLLLGLATTLLALPQAVNGQDALGRGDALDNNLRVGSGGRNFGAHVPDFVARNLLVTQDVPGGRGFRGSVGYTAARDFRGELGSDDLFSFRADSAMSSAGFWQYGPSAEQARFGEALGNLTYRRDFTTRAPIVAAAPGSALDRTIMLDRLVSSVSQADMVTTAMMPQVVGVMHTDAGRLLASASSLRGVTLTADAETAGLVGLTLFDMLSLREQLPVTNMAVETAKAGEETVADTRVPLSFVPGDQFRLDFSPEIASAAIMEQAPVDRQFQMRLIDGMNDVSIDYAQLVQNLVTRYGDAQDVTLSIDSRLLEDLDESYDGLRQRLLGAPGMPDEVETGETPTGATTPAGTGETTEEGAEGAAGAGGTGGTGDSQVLIGAGAQARGKTLAEFGIVLRHGETISTFAGDAESRFNELLVDGQHQLAQGEYFRAERLFQRALRFTPGHPLASIGLGHSQLGAGLYRVAAASIGHALRNHPEIIDAQYASGLLPTSVRMMEIVDELRSENPGADDASVALLEAYIGHQIGDDALIDEGLAAMDADDALTQLLQRVWGEAPSK